MFATFRGSLCNRTKKHLALTFLLKMVPKPLWLKAHFKECAQSAFLSSELQQFFFQIQIHWDSIGTGYKTSSIVPDASRLMQPYSELFLWDIVEAPSLSRWKLHLNISVRLWSSVAHVSLGLSDHTHLSWQVFALFRHKIWDLGNNRTVTAQRCQTTTKRFLLTRPTSQSSGHSAHV